VHLHLATGMMIRGHIDWIYNRVRRDIPKPLLTYAYPEAVETIPVHLLGSEPVRLLVDSGAFTAFTQGQVLRPEEYAEWGRALERRWSWRLAGLRFFSLDVIGDQEASWRNHTRLEQLGLQTIPIVTYGAEMRHLDRALCYPYMALGGLVPLATRRAELESWLDVCFARVRAHQQRVGTWPKVHILGISQEWVLNRYPAYSADSSTWANVMRFGAIRFGEASDMGGHRQMPKPQSQREQLITCAALRREINVYRQMERHATERWTARGVTFED